MSFGSKKAAVAAPVVKPTTPAPTMGEPGPVPAPAPRANPAYEAAMKRESHLNSKGNVIWDDITALFGVDVPCDESPLTISGREYVTRGPTCDKEGNPLPPAKAFASAVLQRRGSQGGIALQDIVVMLYLYETDDAFHDALAEVVGSLFPKVGTASAVSGANRRSVAL